MVDIEILFMSRSKNVKDIKDIVLLEVIYLYSKSKYQNSCTKFRKRNKQGKEDKKKPMFPLLKKKYIISMKDTNAINFTLSCNIPFS